MPNLALSIVTRDYDYVAPLALGDVTLERINLTVIRTFDAIARFQSEPGIDAGEASFSRYLHRIATGDGTLVGLPIFVMREFRPASSSSSSRASSTPSSAPGRPARSTPREARSRGSTTITVRQNASTIGAPVSIRATTSSCSGGLWWTGTRGSFRVSTGRFGRPGIGPMRITGFSTNRARGSWPISRSTPS
jgi:hypothetical protein